MNKEIPEEMKDQMLAIIDNFHKQDWSKLEINLSKMLESTKDIQK